MHLIILILFLILSANLSFNYKNKKINAVKYSGGCKIYNTQGDNH